MSLDRSNQNYWIFRYGDYWSVRAMSGRYICDYPKGYDDELLMAVCYAKNDEEVHELLKDKK